MAYSAKEIRSWTPAEREKRLEELRNELLRLRSTKVTAENPSRFKVLRRTIARILTIMNEEARKQEEQEK
ncbi:MAG: 50S ribosomal protein L29 [Candidatus Odinarchaeota archaeon]|nr:50S ribosomal protein L29 [Candidatus Odinarchaeota archaeon]